MQRPFAVLVAHTNPRVAANFASALRRRSAGSFEVWNSHDVGLAPPSLAPSFALAELGLTIAQAAHEAGASAHEPTAPQFIVVTGDNRSLAAPSPPARRTRGGLAPGVRRRVCEHIEQQLAKPQSRAELARLAELSEYHFARAFKRSVGVTPHRYLMTRRVAVAAHMVRSSNRSMSEIALEVGFRIRVTSPGCSCATWVKHPWRTGGGIADGRDVAGSFSGESRQRRSSVSAMDFDRYV